MYSLKLEFYPFSPYLKINEATKKSNKRSHQARSLQFRKLTDCQDADRIEKLLHQALSWTS